MALFLLERKGTVVTVDMNDAQFCDFGQKNNAIGTRNLKGCHVVIVFSSRGAVLAHIAPGPGVEQPRTPESMGNHVIDNMRTLASVYTANRSFFPDPGVETHTVHAWLDGEIASSNQKELIRECLTRLGLPEPSTYRYDVDLKANAMPESNKGTVVLLGSSPPRLLVEDKIVSPVGQALSSSALAKHSESAASSSSQTPSNSHTPSGVPNNHTGWVYVGAAFVLFKSGVATAQQSTCPLNQLIYNPLGWQGTTKNWARWDGDQTHEPVYL